MLEQILIAVYWVSGLIVLAEGANKLHRTDPLARGLSALQRVVVLTKVAAWLCLSVGAAGAIAQPFVGTPAGIPVASLLIVDRISLVDVLSLGGFALLIVRSRLKEGQV